MRRGYSNVSFFLLIFLTLLVLFPFAIVVLTSLRTQQDVVTRGVFAPPEFVTLQNFPDAWRMGRFSVYYKNSLSICLVKVPLGIFIAALAAYPLAKYRFRLRETLLAFFLLGLGIPVNVVLLPLTILLKKLYLLDNLWGLLFPYIVFGLPFQILVLRGFFRGIPDELVDAARIDGCTEFLVLLRVILPLSVPAVLALFIMDFLATWNEFLMALIFIHSDKWKTVPLGMMYFQGQFASSYPIINAGVLLGILPVVVVYVLLQRYFVSGITAGALKE
jgi:raffinose/stachyose/melibiose transport system permease protein